MSTTSCAHSCSDLVQYPSRQTFNAILSIVCKNISAAKFKKILSKLAELSIRDALIPKNISPSRARRL